MHPSGAILNKVNQQEEHSFPGPLLSDREAFLLCLADTSLILAQRNAEWCGHGPILEQDIAITNISLDLLGQARNFYQYAAVIINENQRASAGNETHPPPETAAVEATEDTLAYRRTEREFNNLLITELPKGHWAQTILRQFFCSVYLYLLYEQLQKTNDSQLAAIAEKSVVPPAYVSSPIIRQTVWWPSWSIRNCW